jgi:hypothetical protein
MISVHARLANGSKRTKFGNNADSECELCQLIEWENGRKKETDKCTKTAGLENMRIFTAANTFSRLQWRFARHDTSYVAA